MFMTVKQASEQGAYGNSKLLFELRIYRYDKGNGGGDYGNKKYYFKASYRKRNVTR